MTNLTHLEKIKEVDQSRRLYHCIIQGNLVSVRADNRVQACRRARRQCPLGRNMFGRNGSTANYDY